MDKRLPTINTNQPIDENKIRSPSYKRDKLSPKSNINIPSPTYRNSTKKGGSKKRRTTKRRRTTKKHHRK